jgi:thiol-disulfide isomerase/thioredoxin
MNILKLKIFIFIISQLFFITTLTHAATKVPFDNIIVNKQPINYEEIIFEDFSGNIVNLKNYKDSIYVLNFWATWCAPCKEEMPSLDILSQINGIKVFPINLEKKNQNKTKIFFDNLNIKNLDIFFDGPVTLAKDLSLRGVPTTVLFNKEGKEFSRIIGSINFNDKEFHDWLSNYN